MLKLNCADIEVPQYLRGDKQHKTHMKVVSEVKRKKKNHNTE